MQQLKVRDKMNFEFSSFSVQRNINYNDTAATVTIFQFFLKVDETIFEQICGNK